MSASPSRLPPLAAFAGCGIELEYMIVDQGSLEPRPIADALLGPGGEHPRGDFGWSNELALHLLEVKNPRPAPALAPLAAGFQAEVREINRRLAPLGARLMPGGVHPWMDPRRQTRLWSHDNAALYAAYHRIFDCHRHGWANLQSMHVNLPFASDGEFARLHAAVRVLLPILPALAASSPVAEGAPTGLMDFRMEAYRTHPIRVPSLIGRVIPDTARSRGEYEAMVLASMYRDIAPLDPEGLLRHEWLNCRGAIPRFDRSAIEIRVIDVQECPAADLAIAEAAVAVARALYDARWGSLEQQQGLGTEALAAILAACTRDGDEALIDDGAYLALFGLARAPATAGALWRHLAQALLPAAPPLDILLQQGPLARRMLRALGSGFDRGRLEALARALCDCLEAGRLFERLE